jgi:hypothetical protein
MAAPGEGKKSGKKKRKISKHVLEAQERAKVAKQQETRPGDEGPLSSAKKEQSKSPAKTVKDPSEASAYLTSWKAHSVDSAGEWKFNKNTQNWLIRHAYENDKVNKSAFLLLSEYLKGLKGSSKTRVISDARRRALRYKAYEKGEAASENKKAETTKKDVDEDDEKKWKELDDHEKRKEYKRARKILESLEDS